MQIGFIDLAGPRFPGGCEKYFSNLAKYTSIKNNSLFFHSDGYVSIMEWIYFLLIRHKKNKVQYVDRDLGNTKVVNLTSAVLFPWSSKHKEIKNLMQNCHSIYVKNEFQDLLFAYLILGRNDYNKKVVIGVHSAIFIPNKVKGTWKFIHDLQYESWFYKHMISNAKKIHIPTSAYISKLKSEFGIANEKITVIQHPIDTSPKFNNNIKNTTFKILWMGRLTQQKGIEFLVKVINNLSSKSYFNNLEIIIGGQGEEDNKISKIARNFKNVHYLGFVNNTKKIYTKADLAIVTSYFEVFPYSVLEPQSYGIPVICTPVDGAEDIIIENKTGLIANNIDDFVSGIEKYYNKKSKNYKAYNLMRKKNFEQINKIFSRNNIYLKLNKMLLEL